MVLPFEVIQLGYFIPDQLSDHISLMDEISNQLLILLPDILLDIEKDLSCQDIDVSQDVLEGILQ